MNYIQSQVIAAQDEIIKQLTAERDALKKDAERWKVAIDYMTAADRTTVERLAGYDLQSTKEPQ
jgi:hypothetical protein